MKALSELGISPAPWIVESNGVFGVDNVNDANGKMITAIISTKDARLIAAAPELYEHLRNAVVEICQGCEDQKIENCRGKCFVVKWRDALAKAAGEEAK